MTDTSSAVLELIPALPGFGQICRPFQRYGSLQRVTPLDSVPLHSALETHALVHAWPFQRDNLEIKALIVP
ncbi:hypothetical protein [Arthrobacter sp. N199823]|uniref:hypothetical protein n=1 Tax=Arthrobacter sp. N199823 TaxID=2058895 RepID=UPI0021575271|nr:hypothetical protein [Arthrobacter sp. N199823]